MQSTLIFILIGLVVLSFFMWIAYLNRPAYLGYKEDIFLNVHWRWSWKKKQIVGLEAFCPNCDKRLIFDDESCHSGQKLNEKVTFFICPSCDKVGSLTGGNRHYVQKIVKHELAKRTNSYVKPKE